MTKTDAAPLEVSDEQKARADMLALLRDKNFRMVGGSQFALEIVSALLAPAAGALSPQGGDGAADGSGTAGVQEVPLTQAEAALALLKRIRYHAERHSLPRQWLTAADEVLGTWGSVKTTHPEVASGVNTPDKEQPK